MGLKDFPLVFPGDSIPELIIAAVKSSKKKIQDGDIFAIAQKIVSKSENRYRFLTDYSPSKEAKEIAKKIGKDERFVEAVLQESNKVVRYRKNVLIVEHKLGFIHANAGIDRSNIDQSNERILLLPLNPDNSANKIRLSLKRYFKADVGVIITDTMGRPFRNGIVGFAIGASNINSIRDERGKKDLFGNELKVTQIGIADELAAAASLVMGQADQSMPVVLIRGHQTIKNEISNAQVLIREEEEDLFR
ncbi:MAG: coenzyme F420-0:L-glutamate ligase [Gammaproteobacteria bacterium]